MESKKIIIGNLKMVMDLEQTSEYLKVINKELDSKAVIICPTSIYIPYFLKNNYKVGLQNVAVANTGPYTGEVSPKQAVSMGIKYTLVGHSDRRIHLNESDTIINKKIIEAIKYNMHVVLCIGETEEERSLLRTDKVIKRQLTSDLNGLDQEMFDNLVIAYEPVWAIGDKAIPSNREIEEVIMYIKNFVKKQYKVNIPVLYGGSVDEKNVKKLCEIEKLSGFIVGGASLDANRFLKIIETVKEE